MWHVQGCKAVSGRPLGAIAAKCAFNATQKNMPIYFMDKPPIKEN